MMWADEGIVLAVRRHGEADAVLHALTFEHGRHAGLVKGGYGRMTRPLLQPGNVLELEWHARLAEHLGSFRAEPKRLLAGGLLDDPLRLAALASACALLDAALPERDPHPQLYAALLTWLDRLATRPDWAADYIRLELLVLGDLGFALDLSACAVSGATDGLAFVSPRTGRAVSAAAAEPFRDRLLPLPGFLVGDESDARQIPQGLKLAGHFLSRHIFAPTDRPLPAARERLVALLGAAALDDQT